MSGMQSLNGASDSQSLFAAKRSRSNLEIDSWMPSEIQAISPLVDRVMLLIEGSQCVSETEFDVELALREALGAICDISLKCECGPADRLISEDS